MQTDGNHTGTGLSDGAQRRGDIGERYRWDLSHIFPDNAAWKKAKRGLISRITTLSNHRGSLTSSAGSLLACLRLADDLRLEYMRLVAYAGMSSDQDTRNSAFLAMQTEMGQLGSTFAAEASYIEPEILLTDPATIDEFLDAELGLCTYRHYLLDIRRRARHTGTPGEERIIAEAGLIAEGPGDIYGIFTNADFPYPLVTLAGGESVVLTPSAFSIQRASTIREDREKTFSEFFSKLGEFSRTFGTQLNAQVRKDLFFSRARNYPSCLEAALHDGNIPTGVYRNLISTVREHLPTFHRYLTLRQRLLEIPELHYSDLYAPLVQEVEKKYTYDEATDLVLASVSPLGTEYVDVTARAFRERWIDVYPADGKRSGAYSNGIAYDVHPYILLNYNGRYDDVSTITHELGHTIHSWLSNQKQPYATSQYSIFVAEVASTFNEALLFDHILNNTADRSGRLSLLGHYLEHFKATVFRQTQFAEFELLIHEAVERGEALTGDMLDELYLGLARTYYGHDGKVCVVDDFVKSEWSYIPHFYYNFYVYQYATGVSAACALAERVVNGGDKERDEYLGFLKAGCSKYPTDTLKDAGVDMCSPEPVKTVNAKTVNQQQ